MNEFETLFEFTPYLYFAWPVALMAGGLVVAIVVEIRSGRWRTLAIFFPGLLLIAFGYSAVVSWREYSETRWHVAAHDVRYAEGSVVNVKWRCNGTLQTFAIDEIQFQGSNCFLSPGFVPGFLGIPSVREGMFARAEYFDASWGERVITKFEVRVR